MNTLDDLLEAIPGLRRTRSINADWLRTLLDRRKGQCTWCGQQVPKGSRTWCSDACVQEFKLRCCSQTQARHVLKRDAGICQECGRDTIEAESEFERRWAEEKKNHGVFFSQYKDAMKDLQTELGFARGSWREVDHIVPVVLGGGLCGVDNLRLLCGKCHAKECQKLSRIRKEVG